MSPATTRDHTPDTPSIPWRSPTLQVILGTMLVSVMGVSLIAPVLPVIRDTFALTGAQTGLVITVFALPGIVMAPLMGVLADRFGRRRVIIPCLIAYGITGSAITLVPNFEALLVLRFLQGVAGSGLSTLAITLIGDWYSGVQRNAVMGINSTVISVGTSTYPLIGGVFAGIAWNVPFLLFILGAVVGLFALRALEEPRIESSHTVGLRYIKAAAASVSPRESIIIYGLTFLIFFSLFGALLTLVPLLLDDQYGLSAARIGLVLTGAAITSGLVASQNGRAARYLTNIELIGIGILLHGLSLAGIGLVLVGTAPVVFVAAAVIAFGAGSGLSIPAMNTAVSSLTTGQYRGGAVSLRTSFIRVGETIGPILFPLTAGLLTYHAVLLGFGTFLILLGALVWLRRHAEFAETPTIQ